MTTQTRPFRPVKTLLALAVLLGGFLCLLVQRLGCVPGWGGGAGAGVNPPGGNPPAQAAPADLPAASQSKPLEITIDEARYFVNNKPVESVDELVKMSLSVPKEVIPRVRVVRRPTARFSAEKNLSDALEAAKVDFVMD
jgi:hypothetical protein